jgi:hypothetical protein
MSPYPAAGATCLLHGKRVRLRGPYLVHDFNGQACGSQRFAITWHTDRDEVVDALRGLAALAELDD